MRLIPAQLLDHLSQDETTTCHLIKVTPVTVGYAPYGVTSLNRDLVYQGQLYSAAIGMNGAAIATSSNMSVNNTEAASLLPEFDVPISEADVRAGIYDYADFELMLVNYEDLSQGHTTLLAGKLGQITVNQDGLSIVNELRGLAAELKQSVCQKDSLTCRAIFGSQPIGSPIPGPQVRIDWCGYDATNLLVEAAVEEVGLEGNRTFRVYDSGLPAGYLSPGMAFWITGANAGRGMEIEDNDDDGNITLAYETPFQIQVGDLVQYRRDCNKQARDEEKGCKSHWVTEWVLHFRGEPDIPIGDAGVAETPFASRTFQDALGDAIADDVE